MTKLVPPRKARQLITTPQELVHIKHKISLRQYKYWLLMLRAYREAYELQGVSTEQGFYRMPIATLETWLGYELVRSELRSDLEAIRREPIIYNVLSKDGKKVLRGAGFISEWELSSNWIGFKLPGFLRESVEQLDLKTSIFQKINWEVFNSFTGKYEAVLYKLCRDYVGAKRTPPFSIEEYRDYMGLREHEYAAFKDLNKFVISAPIKRINESTTSDITIEALFTRQARKVVGVQFSVVPKYQTILDLGDDPAFRFSRITISLPQQKEYLSAKPAAMIELSIQRANEYADEQEKQGKDVNLGALYRKAIDEDWGKEYQAKKARDVEKATARKKTRTAEQEALEAERNKELREDFQRERTTAAIKALTNEERCRHAEAYMREAGEGRAVSWSTEKADFTNSVERVRFTTWLRKASTPTFDEVAFKVWAKKKRPNQTQLEGA
jgi:hypothetical protein